MNAGTDQGSQKENIILILSCQKMLLIDEKRQLGLFERVAHIYSRFSFMWLKFLEFGVFVEFFGLS